MNPAGELRIAARYADGLLGKLTVNLQRPPISRLFVGQAPHLVLKTIPYLYTLCAEAQRAAARAALTAAGAVVPEAAPDSRELWIEFLHETLWRLLLDWPAALGIPSAREAFAEWRNARHGDQRLAATEALLAGPLAEIAAAAESRLPDAVDHGAQPIPELSPLTPADWLPYWLGRADTPPAWPRPTSIAAACRRRVAEARIAAAALAAGDPFPVAAAGALGSGIGQAWTARGVLTHAVQLDNEQVSHYRVWAPTDRYFADPLALAALIADSRFADEAAARQRLEQAILALDPCLPYSLELHHA